MTRRTKLVLLRSILACFAPSLCRAFFFFSFFVTAGRQSSAASAGLTVLSWHGGGGFEAKPFLSCGTNEPFYSCDNK